MNTYLLSIDQGTSATKCVLIDDAGRIVAKFSVALTEQLPQPGWVEQDGEAIWNSVCAAVHGCLAQCPDDIKIAGVGISTQRESAILWQRRDGRAISPLLSWQDQRTALLCEQLSTPAVQSLVRERSGLPLDPMFSALKISWLLDQLDPQRAQARSGAWGAGTVDAYLLSRLGGDFVSEIGNASRTQLLTIHTGNWDDDLLALFNVPRALLPSVVPSVSHFAVADRLHSRLRGVPVLAIMADSHAALFAHGAFTPGQIKATLGTGSSVMALSAPGTLPHPGLCQTIAWDVGQGAALALEGNIRAAGATLRWLADLFSLPVEAAAELATASQSSGVFIVPGFNGLGAPWWDSKAVGLICGLSLSSDKAALLAAGLESIAHQVADVIEAMDERIPSIQKLYLDGGPSRNRRLLETLSAYIKRPVVQCADAELSALGVAHLAGLQAQIWDWSQLKGLLRAQQEVRASATSKPSATCREQWALAVKRARLVK